MVGQLSIGSIDTSCSSLPRGQHLHGLLKYGGTEVSLRPTRYEGETPPRLVGGNVAQKVLPSCLDVHSRLRRGCCPVHLRASNWVGL
jgi:hypothetical protein